MSDEKKRDVWSRWAIVLQPLGGLLTAAAIAFIGVYSTNKLEASKEKETRARLYIELMTKREESESALRKDMFTSIMQSFLGSDKDTPEARLLKLELLTYNFHESLILQPLFEDLKRQITQQLNSEPARRTQALDRLNRAAREISKKQTAILMSGGTAFNKTIAFDSTGQAIRTVVYEDILSLNGILRQFTIRVLNANPESRELDIFLAVNTILDSAGSKNKSDQKIESISASFNVGFFDFPMIDNTRLSHDQRCAVVLRDIKKNSADITLIYFPGSYSSLKEKPYYQEVLDKLRFEDME